MNIIKNFPLLLLIFAASCSPIVTREEPAPLATAVPSLVTQVDIDFAQAFANDVFTKDEWKSEITLHNDRVMRTWNKNNSSNLAYLDYRIYPEGYTQADLDYYYSDETFKDVLFTYYDDLNMLAQCEQGSLTLYQFSAGYMETPYFIYDWVNTSNPKRIAEVSIIFSQDDQADLERYAKEVFPSLPNCE